MGLLMAEMLGRHEVAARIMQLPADLQGPALSYAIELYGTAERRSGNTQGPRRNPGERRAYAGDPWKYFSDVLGYHLTLQQEDALELIETSDRVLLPSGNNLGKSFLLAGYGVYRFDAVAALPDDELDLEEQGAQILLPGPDHDTVFHTIYSAMLEHAARAERRGYAMPGRRSERSVLWSVRPRWYMEVFSPPNRVGQEVAHTASGRHHKNQIALVEEGQGVQETLWRGAEGMCSSSGNKIVSAFNPTEPIGPAYQRARSGAYKVMHLSAFEHPNVRERRLVIPAAVDFKKIDSRIRTECRDRGPYPGVLPDPEQQDFICAIPDEDVDTEAAREDGHLGHRDAQLRVYRPTPSFVAQVLGRWPTGSDHGLFDPASWDAAAERWKRSNDPDSPPDRVGADPAREGDDDTCAAPAWGGSAEGLIRGMIELQAESPASVPSYIEENRCRVGELRILAKGDGPDVAAELFTLFPASPFNMDIGSVGSSPYDHMRRVMGLDVEGVSFSATPPDPLPGIPWCENMRTWLYVMAARLVRLGLVDVPDDGPLREEVLAHEVMPKARVVEVEENGRKIKKRMPSVLLIPKDDIKKKIGRSPDRSDAFVLSLYSPLVSKKRRWEFF